MYTKIADVVHEMDSGRWIVAHEEASQWRSYDIEKGPFEDYCYAYANALKGLAKAGIRTYATREEAEAAAREIYCED